MAHKSSGTYQQYAHSEAARELDLHELLDNTVKVQIIKSSKSNCVYTKSIIKFK